MSEKRTNENNLLFEIIDRVSQFNSLKNSNSRKPTSEVYEKHSLYKEKKVERINHITSGTYYTAEYLDSLEKILGSSNEFINLSDYDKQLIQSTLESLSHDDYILKTYLHKSIHEENKLHNLFPESFAKFSKGFNLLLLGSPNSYNKSTFRQKYKIFYEKIISLLIENNYNIDILRGITNVELDIVFEEYLTPSIVYDAFCVMLLKTARNTLLSNDKNKFNYLNMSVLHHQVIYRVYRHLIMISISHGITCKIVNMQVILPIDSLIRSVRNFILHKHNVISITKEYTSFVDGIESLFNCFTQSGLFVDITKEFEGKKSFKRYYFPTELSENLGKYTSPPRVWPPEKVTSENLLDFIIPTDYGKIDLIPSAQLIRSLKISNNKKFKINVNFLLILKELERFNDLTINYPLPSKITLSDLYEKKESFDLKFNKFAICLVDIIQAEFAKRKSEIEYKHQYRYMVNQTKAESAAITERLVLENKFSELAVERKGGLTRIALASVLEGFPLYYTNTLCSTTRVFAKEYILSRHIGCLKLLRCNYNENKVNVHGVVHMLRAYYSEDNSTLKRFEEFSKNLNTNLKSEIAKLRAFYEGNRIDYASKEAVSHYMLLSVELKRVFEGNKTGLLLQFDQVASGLVFIAILFKNQELAKRTNITHSDYIDGPYEYAMKQFESFYNSSVPVKNHKAMKFASSSKKLHKYALMCYSYNQTVYGRTNDFVDLWVSEFGRKPDSDEWCCLNSISTQYVKFIDVLFPGIDQQFEILDKIVNLVVRNAGYLKVRTIDGSSVIWKFYKTKRNIRKSFNPHTLVPENYSIYTGVTGDNGLPLIDVKQFKVKFRSYLIHSVDAGVMRMVVNRMYDRSKIRIDQLHDCVLVHPNFVEDFYTEIEKVYLSEPFKDFMNTHVFTEFRSIISSDKFDSFDKLTKEFNSNMSSVFEINGDFRKVYKPEM